MTTTKYVENINNNAANPLTRQQNIGGSEDHKKPQYSIDGNDDMKIGTLRTHLMPNISVTVLLGWMCITLTLCEHTNDDNTMTHLCVSNIPVSHVSPV